jgi:Protein of unknown function (DUF4012)
MTEKAGEKSTTTTRLKLFIKLYFVVFFVLVLIWGILLGFHLVSLYRLANSLRDNPSLLQTQDIVSTVNEATNNINAIYGQLRPLFPVVNAMQGVPLVGRYLGQVEPLLTYMDSVARAGNEIILATEPLLDKESSSADDQSLTEQASQVLQAGHFRFISAAQALDQADSVREEINPDLMPGSLRTIFLNLDGKFNLLVAGAKILQVAPGLMGINQTQDYLVLAQNRDELRSTGGFISGIGLFSLQEGKITGFSLGDSYAVDDFSKPYPVPPEALKRFMLADYWVTRDANWSPDFIISAQEAQTLYTLSTGIETQGVIAFNQLAVQKVLEVIGPVQVPGTDEPVTAQNVVDYMRRAWAPSPEEGLSPEWWLHRKDFMQQLGSVILEKALKSRDQEQFLKLAKTLVSLLEQGQLLVYFNDPMAESALEISSLDGGLHPGNGDYLYLVDSNIGFNKVDSVVQRSIDYKVDLSDISHPTGEVIMNYQHSGIGDRPCKQEISYGSGTYQDLQQRCYLDYWRVYVPAGSEFQTSDAKPVAAEQLLNGVGWSGKVETLAGEAGTQILAGLLMLPIGQSSEINILYDLPTALLQTTGDGEIKYTLRVQVQPGLEGLSFQVEIEPPESFSPIRMQEYWKLSNDGILYWQGVLDHSTEFSMFFQRNP